MADRIVAVFLLLAGAACGGGGGGAPPSQAQPASGAGSGSSGTPGGGASAPAAPFRVMTWNIYCHNTADARLEEMAAAVVAARADAVLFQEMPRPLAANTAAGDEIYLDKVQAKLEAASGKAWSYVYGRGDEFAGFPIQWNAIFAVAEAGLSALEGGGKRFEVPIGDGRHYTAGFASLGGEWVLLVTTHLKNGDTNGGMRARELDYLARDLATRSAAVLPGREVILGGDMNFASETEAQAQEASLAAAFPVALADVSRAVGDPSPSFGWYDWDAATGAFLTFGAMARLDALYLSPALAGRVRRYEVLQTSGTTGADHLPVIVETGPR